MLSIPARFICALGLATCAGFDGVIAGRPTVEDWRWRVGAVRTDALCQLRSREQDLAGPISSALEGVHQIMKSFAIGVVEPHQNLVRLKDFGTHHVFVLIL